MNKVKILEKYLKKYDKIGRIISKMRLNLKKDKEKGQEKTGQEKTAQM